MCCALHGASNPCDILSGEVAGAPSQGGGQALPGALRAGFRAKGGRSQVWFQQGPSRSKVVGRAGRRGFDLRGNIVFCGMGSSKITRLMRSKLPVLQGNQILSATTVLRLVMMHAGTVDKIDSAAASDVVRSVTGVVTLPIGAFQFQWSFHVLDLIESQLKYR